MLRSPLVCASLAALSLAVLGGTISAGCSSSTVDPPPPAEGASKDPPKAKADAGKGDGPGVVLAVSKLFLGDTDRKGSPKSDAWQDYGYNLDGEISTAKSTKHCKPRAGAPQTVKADGKGGVDNSFGKTLVPLIVSLAAGASGKINETIAQGTFTVITKIDGIGAKADYNDLASSLYVGGKLASPPKFDGTDKWPVVPELLDSPTDINSSKVKFPKSYLVGNTWVSGTPAALTLQLSFAGYTLNLEIVKAIITQDIAADRKSATNGIIAGVIPLENLIAEIRKIAGNFQKDLCSGNTFDTFADTIRQAADINADGGQDPSKECDAISIGLGFEAKAIQLGTVAPKSDPKPDPCTSMGGAGGSSAGGSSAGGSSAGGSSAGGSSAGGAGGK